MTVPADLSLATLRRYYQSGGRPAQLIHHLYDRLEQQPAKPVWIHLLSRADALAQAERLGTTPNGPLYGIPFALKDNIDVAGLPTTAACPAFAYTPNRSAFLVERLLAAGALLIGKTNMDQFATGLVGTRTPFGACSCVFDARYISGGSSSGSAVSVANGLVSFSIGTDTAGSGRVPAAFNNLIGLKPTRGVLSMTGVVPACRSLDCPSIFALDAQDAADVFAVARAYDAADPYSRTFAPPPSLRPIQRVAVPMAAQREFLGDAAAERMYRETLDTLAASGFDLVEVDLQPFLETAALLYAGPYVAERYAAVGGFLDGHPNDAHPVVAGIIRSAARYSASDAYQAEYKLKAIQRHLSSFWDQVDALVLPTAPTIYTIEEVERDPVRLNANLGYYTNFVNLLDLSAVAIPTGFRPDGLPFGVTAVAAAFCEESLLAFAALLQKARTSFAGNHAAGVAAEFKAPTTKDVAMVKLAVVGAHLSGQPLNGQLLDRGAHLLATTRTAPGYKLYALEGTKPPKPGLVRVPGFAGPGIEVEVWSMPQSAFGSFVQLVPAPLAIGTCELMDGEQVKGFVCEPYAAEQSEDITHFGSWRKYLAN